VRFRTRFWAIATLPFLALGACREAPERQGLPNASPSPIPVGSREFAGIAWPSGNWLVVAFVPKPQDPAASVEVWRVHPDGRGFRRLPLPDDPRCERTQYLSPVSLSDGRVGLIKACDLDPHNSPIPTSYSLVAVSPRDGEINPLVTDKMLGYLRSFAAPGLSVSPDKSKAILSVGNLLCESLSFVDANGVKYLPIRVGSGESSWRLDEYFLSDSRLCTDLGRAGGASWSPDGEAIAFLGSPQSIGVSGVARLDAPWNLYVMAPGTWAPHLVLADLTYPSEPSWSPDGRWLTFSGSVEGNGEGTWLLNLDAGQLKRLTTVPVASPVWSPDGRTIVGIVPVEGPGSKEKLVLLDASSLLDLR